MILCRCRRTSATCNGAMALDDGLPTITSRDQAELERRVLEIYSKDYGDGAPWNRARADCWLWAAAPPPALSQLPLLHCGPVHLQGS